jgi:hypothetical protein
MRPFTFTTALVLITSLPVPSDAGVFSRNPRNPCPVPRNPKAKCSLLHEACDTWEQIARCDAGLVCQPNPAAKKPWYSKVVYKNGLCAKVLARYPRADEFAPTPGMQEFANGVYAQAGYGQGQPAYPQVQAGYGGFDQGGYAQA